MLVCGEGRLGNTGSDCQSRGRGFKSRRARHSITLGAVISRALRVCPTFVPHVRRTGVGSRTMRAGLLMMTVALVAGCATAGSPPPRCPGEPLSTHQIEDIRAAQRAIRDRRPHSFADPAVAAYFNKCGHLDPVTKKRVIGR